MSDKINIPDDTFNRFNKEFVKLKGKKYSKKIINNLIESINEYTLQNEFTFINANYSEIVQNDNHVDIKIDFDDLDKFYVERINIFGNFITDEKVIRNTLIVDEGDAFNEILFEKSIKNLQAKNIFKKVEYESYNTENLNKVIDITVEEKPTGEIFAGAGTGTTGSSITAGIKENNYLGIGIKLDTNLTITDDTIKGKFSATNPNFNNTDKSIKTEIESLTNDYMSTGGYKTSRTGVTIGTEFEQLSDLFVNLELSNYYEDLETSSTATSIIKKQEGNYFENLISYRISYNILNQNFQPTDGFVTNFSQTFTIYSDDVSVENTFTSSNYHSVNDNLILSAKLYLKAVNSLDDNVRVSKRVYVPGRRLRGFESGKIGPKDGTQYIGGNYASALNLNTTLPNVLFENENIDFNLFLDFANVWEVDYKSSLDSNHIRSSTGFAVNWFSTIGPLTFSYAIPLSEADTDMTEKFRFRIGTSLMKVFFIIFFLLFNFEVYAKTNIVYIDIQYIIDNSNLGKFYKNKLKKIESNLKESMLKKEVIKNNQIEINNQKNILKEEEIKKKIKQLNELVKNYNIERNNANNEIIENKKKYSTEILKLLNPLLTDYVEKNKIKLIINKKNILVDIKTLDITEEILKIFDQKTKDANLINEN